MEEAHTASEQDLDRSARGRVVSRTRNSSTPAGRRSRPGQARVPAIAGTVAAKAGLALAALFLVSGCSPSVPVSPDFTPSQIRIVPPNTAPRGTEAFCRIYGQQTATNRAFSSGRDGRGPRGFDRASARLEGERAYRRCLAGRTN